jgi:hypothetical protein
METTVQLTAEEITEETNHNQVTLVLPSNGDATRVREFTDKIRQVFAAKILKVIGSWTETLITVQIDKSVTTEDILNNLVNIPQVERAEKNKSIKERGTQSQCILVVLAANTPVAN